MKKVFPLISLIGLLAVGSAIIANPKSKVALADNPLSGTITTNFKNLYDDTAGDPDSSYFKLINDGNIPVYYSGEETNLFSASVTQGSATEKVKVRNRNNSGTYYLYLKYNSSKAVDTLGSEIVFSTGGSYKFRELSTFIYQGQNHFSVYISDDNTNWSLDKIGGSKDAINTVTLSKPSPYVKIAHTEATAGANEWLVFKDVSLDFYDAASLKYVTFNSCGGSDVDSQEVATGSTATRPVDPTKPSEGSTGYSFLGWYTEETGGELFDFDTPINNNLTLYAHWEPRTITGYTLYFETDGGTSIEPQVVPMDGTKFTKPADPTKASDSVYQYPFHKWYTDNTLSTEFDFNATPTGDAIAYAGYIKQGYQPSGYSTVDPKRKSDVWGTDEMRADYGAWQLESTETFTYNQPAFPNIRLNVIPNGSTNSGAKLISTNEVRINNTKVRYQITDPTKYFAAFRLELYVKDYSKSHSKLATLSTGGITSDSGYTPYDSTNHASLVLIGNCEGKPQEFTLDVGDISANGTRLRYIYAMIGTYTTEEIAINYATNFNDANVCGTLDTDGLNETKWSQQAQLFDGIGSDAQAYLREYEGSNSEIIECLQRYDRVITLHGVSYDFMGRVEAGKINLGSTKTISNALLNSNDNSTILIVLISVISISTICGYVFISKYYKKKDN